MNILRYFALLSCTLGVLGAVLGADWSTCKPADLEAAMRRAEEKLEKLNTYAMELSMASYSDPDAPAADQAKSTILRDGQQVYVDQLGLVTYQDAALCAVADPAEKIVVLSEARPLFDLVMNERTQQLLQGAERLVIRTDIGGSEFRIFYTKKSSAYSHVDVRYDAQGYLVRVVLQWQPTMVGEQNVPLARLYSPRVVFDLGKPRSLMTGEKRLMAEGFGARLKLENGTYRTIGPWANYRIVDTRYRP